MAHQQSKPLKAKIKTTFLSLLHTYRENQTLILTAIGYIVNNAAMIHRKHRIISYPSAHKESFEGIHWLWSTGGPPASGGQISWTSDCVDAG
jgi:hypothetical protein